MSIRKITSMTMFLSLAVLLINSIVLYVVPEGRVAYWSDWSFLGLSKSQWGEQHTTVGVLFLIAGLLHIYYNWNPIVAYMKNKARQVKIFTGPFNAALVLTIIFIVGTYYQIPPMSTIVNISDSFKHTASIKYGEPPYGHAETSSLKMFSQRENLDLDKAMALLTEANIPATDPKETIKQIAARSNNTPQQIYDLIKPATLVTVAAESETNGPAFPEAPKPGWGKKKLSDICLEYNLQPDAIISSLSGLGINAMADSKVKEIAENNNIEPMQVFEALYTIVNSSKS